MQFHFCTHIFSYCNKYLGIEYFMSIYHSVNALADIIGKRCSNLETTTDSGIFSSGLSIQERRKIVKRKFWERLLQRNRAEDEEKAAEQNDVTGGLYLFLESLMAGNLQHEDFSQCLQTITQLPDDENSYAMLRFLLKLAKLPEKEESSETMPDKENVIHWRFGTREVYKTKSIDISTPLIDWQLAKNFPKDTFYRTWESPLSELKFNSDVAYDYWHRSRVLMGQWCFSTGNSVGVKQITFDEFFSACKSALMGCSSGIFSIDGGNDNYFLSSEVCVSGLSHDSLISFSRKVLLMSRCFRLLQKFVSIDDSVKPPFVATWYVLAANELIRRYLVEIINIPTQQTKESFLQLSRSYEDILSGTVDIIQLWKNTQRVELVLQNSVNPWGLVEHLFRTALSNSWTVDYSQLDQPLIMEQYLFGAVMNPLLNRLLLAVLFGLSNCHSQLNVFGILLNNDQLVRRDLGYWLGGFDIRRQQFDEVDPKFLSLAELLVSAGRSVEFLKLCKPSHYLISLIISSPNDLPVLKFFPANMCRERKSYLAKHDLFKQDVAQVRDSSRRYLEQIRQLVIQASVDKIRAIAQQLKERDDALKAQKLEEQRLKQERQRQLRDEWLAEAAAHRAAKAAVRAKEIEYDRAMARQLAEEDFTRTEFERRLAEEERRRLIEHYAELERQADWRRHKAEWRKKRLELVEKRLKFLKQSANEMPSPIFDDSEIKAEKVPSLAKVIPSGVVEPEGSFSGNEEEISGKLDVEVEDEKIEEKQVETAVERIPSPADEPVIPVGGKISPNIVLMNESGEPEEVEILNGRELLNLNLEVEAEPEPESQSVKSESHQAEEEISVSELNASQEQGEETQDESLMRLFTANRSISFKICQQITSLETEVGKSEREEETSEQQVLTFSELFETCILQPARGVSEMMNLAVVEYLRDELDVVGHLSALRRYLLMDAGEFAIAVSLPIFEALRSPDKPEYALAKDPVSPFFLETTLANALRYISSPISDLLAEERARLGYGDVFFLQQDFTRKLNISKRDGLLDPQKPYCFDDLELTYVVGWPLNIILPPEDIKIYSKVFSFLLEMYRVVNTLDNGLRLLDDCQVVAAKQAHHTSDSAGSSLLALRLAHHARSLMRFFFTSIQTYLTSLVLRPLWALHSPINALEIHLLAKTYPSKITYL